MEFWQNILVLITIAFEIFQSTNLNSSSDYSSDTNSLEGRMFAGIKCGVDHGNSKKPVYEDPPIGMDPNSVKSEQNTKEKKTCGDDPKERCKENHSGKKRMKKECGHGRVNETRDRLRKKYQLLHGKNTAKMQTAKRVSPLQKPSLNNSPETLTSLCKDMSEMTLKKNQNGNSNGNGNANVNVTVNVNVNANVNINANVNTLPKTINVFKNPLGGETATINQNSSKDTSIEPEKDRNVNKWVKDTLSFIEGSGSSKFPVNDKKAAKKAKQKQRKEESKRVEELQDLRSQFHDIYIKEFSAKNELKKLKTSKKKDKKKITELESNVKKLNKAKSNIETRILESIATVKVTNSEFKFSYLPTKEQQQNALQKKPLTEEEENKNLSSRETPTDVTCDGAGTRNVQFVPIVPNFTASNIQLSYAPQKPGDSADPAKRIVTIRRVNLPNGPEPQVTVTTKATLGGDKLLYTFVNGQLVKTNPPVVSDQQKPTTASQIKTKPNTKPKSAPPSPPASEPKKTKTQLKKERKREKKEADEREEQMLAEIEAKRLEDLEKEQKKDSKKANKKNSQSGKMADLNANTMTSNRNEKKKNGGKGSESPVESQKAKVEPAKKPKTANKMNRTPSVTESEASQKVGMTKTAAKKKKKEEKEAKRAATPNEAIPLAVKEIVTQSPIKIAQKPRVKVIDNGQFDNNQFKMLHLDDLASDISESETEAEPDLNSSVEEKVAKKPNIAPTKSAMSPKIIEEKPNANGIKKPKPVKQTKPLEEISKPAQKAPQPLPIVEKLSKRQKKAANKSKNDIQSAPATNKTKKIPIKPDQNANSIPHRPVASSFMTNSTQHNQPPAPPPYTLFHHDNSSISQNLAYNTNVSIMDQLNRGVQVEHLSLPPGITLTKVDPSKAEAIRAKTESINRLSKPIEQLNSQPPSTMQNATFYPQMMGHYNPSDQSGIIMVDALSSAKNAYKQQPAASTSAYGDDQRKSKNKKRKNKKRSDNFGNENIIPKSQQKINVNEPKMVTLRNPMFHSQSSGVSSMNPMAATQSAPATVRQQPMAAASATVQMDQPAAIIKNENGMFTIRNPALHQAVSNGYPPAGNYRQYTPSYYGSQETQSIPPPQPAQPTASSFSYFSNNSTSGSSGNDSMSGNYQSYNGHVSDNNEGVKCLSAIGSEIKNAQQQKKSKEWQMGSRGGGGGGQDCASLRNNEFLAGLSSSMQQKYQQSNYYNGGFDVFPTSSCGSLFDTGSTHHSCEDSPPPTISGFNHYLDGIPNTGVIRYDDASFLKTLMPGQKLNNEVTIHNVNESNFPRSNSSPIPHRVEITPVFGGNRINDNIFPTPDQQQQQHVHNISNRSYVGDNLGIEFGEHHLFSPNKMLNLNDLELGDRDVESFKRFNYDFEPPKEKQKVNINMNDFILKANKSGTSSRSSPFLDDSALDIFVQNISSLKIDDLNTSINGSSNHGNSPNGWW